MIRVVIAYLNNYILLPTVFILVNHLHRLTSSKTALIVLLFSVVCNSCELLQQYRITDFTSGIIFLLLLFFLLLSTITNKSSSRMKEWYNEQLLLWIDIVGSNFKEINDILIIGYSRRQPNQLLHWEQTNHTSLEPTQTYLYIIVYLGQAFLGYTTYLAPPKYFLTYRIVR